METEGTEMLFEIDNQNRQKASIRVLGVGGAGCNAIDRMVASRLAGVEFIAVNTDAQALDNCNADLKIQIGKRLTKGLGAGAQLDVGEAAAEEDALSLTAAMEGADLIFVTAGMGGGTGTGAAPVVARVARELGALTIGIVTTPFLFEGRKRSGRSLVGLERLRQQVDTLIVIHNQRLLNIVERSTTMTQAFLEADSVLHQATRGISDLINVHGLINLDFADVSTIMKGQGHAIMGTGIASGDDRAIMAAQKAINSPLLDDSNIRGARGLLINITGGEEMTLNMVNEATNLIFEEVGEQANIIFGAVIDKKMKDEIRVTVIATGFGVEDQFSLEQDDFESFPAPIPVPETEEEKKRPPIVDEETRQTPAFLRRRFSRDRSRFEKIEEKPAPREEEVDHEPEEEKEETPRNFSGPVIHPRADEPAYLRKDSDSKAGSGDDDHNPSYLRRDR